MEVLAEWNPWWSDKTEALDELAGTERPDYAEVLESVKMRETTVITGIRRSGKSTLMYQMIRRLIGKGVEPKTVLLVNFEDQALAEIPIEEIYSEYRQKMNPGLKAYVFLDEVQRAEKWELWLRKKYDLKEGAKFVVSGSSSRLLKREYSALLTGRIVSFEIMPFSFSEFLEFSKISIGKKMAKTGAVSAQDRNRAINALDRYLSEGGFPEAFFREREQKRLLLANYFEDIIFRDIVDRYGIRSRKPMELARYLATNLAGKISLRTLRQATGLSYGQIREFLDHYLEAFLFFETNHFSYSLKEQKTRPSKIYCADNGLRNAVAFRFSQDTGKLAENAVFLELKRRGAETYYWKNGHEVDFIVKNPDNSLDAINVSFTDELGKRETEGLLEFGGQNKKAGKLTVITKGLEKNQGGIRFVPLWKWLLEGK